MMVVRTGLAQRIVTAVVLLVLLIGAIALGHNAFSLVAAVLVGIGVFEWLRLVGHAPRLAALVAVAGIGALWWIERQVAVDAVRLMIAWLALSTWGAVLMLLYATERGANARVGRLTGTMLCVILVTAAWFGLMDLSRAGGVMLVSALALVWLADIAAYFAGRAFGRRKLAARISPGKTWAGVVGAIVAVVFLTQAIALAWPQMPLLSNSVLQKVSLAAGVLLLLGLVGLSIIGDLFESLLKRQAGAKDSGTLLPGHGGVLDRIDALLPVLPAFQAIRYGIGA